MSKLPEKIKLDDSELFRLYPHGLPKNISGYKPFELDDAVNTFNSEGDRLSPKRFSKSKQLEFLEKVYKDPLRAPYLMCISGYPDDSYAKMLAALLMCRAFSISKSNPPKWRNIYLGFDNPIVKEGFKPSLLILSNLTTDASNQKIDKLRDCLEYHSNIPRIVVCGGADPLTFFNTRVHLHLNGCVYAQSKRVKKINEL